MKTQQRREHSRKAIAAWSMASATALLLCLPGCFSYVPATLETVPPGEEVRLLVTRQGGFQLSEFTSIDPSSPLVRGRLVAREGAEVLLNVPVTQRREGFHTIQLNQVVRVPVGEIVGIELRQFDGLETGLLVVGGAAVGVGVIRMIMEAFGGVGLEEPADPPEFGVSLFSIPIGE